MYKSKTQSAKYKVKARNLKFYVLSSSFALFALHLALCFAQPISSTELIKDAKQYDGKMVAYQGEVVGDIMIRGKCAWLSVNDGSNAIGIWVDTKLIKDILHTGSYKEKGDLVEIKGEFNRSCFEHGGDLDIHTQSIDKISSGREISQALNIKALHFALGLFYAVFLLFLLKLWRSKRGVPLL